ncbi:unnamed protein product [Fusarium venenatum]|uniref:Uncharacterized protein n=1 Tax=Fusarium venenatum TaxID=56646 RepID=A0A2L2T267_9HYPO|nr:uncharacterized protein FVRRES_00240 [Fusarium venenatum]CEI63728.1 unnamed protein product [Fusarium venenatum]
MSTKPHPKEPRPELERRQSLDIPGADEASSIIGDVSSRIEEATTQVEDDVVSQSPSQTSTVEETTSSTEQPSLPLTTIFTPSKDCTGDDAFKSRTVGSYVYCQLEDGADRSTCYPSSYSEYQYDTMKYYSPGVCPLSYVYLLTFKSGLGNSPTTTYATCCPSGMTELANNWSCQKSLTTHVTITNVTDSQTTVYSTTYWANPIFVAWQESDLSRFYPQSEARAALQSAGVTFPTNTESGSSTSETESGNTQYEDSESGGGGLSTGAIAGIGVGAGIIGIMIIVAIWWFLRRYKVSRRTSNVDEREQPWEQQIYEAPDTRKDFQHIHEAPNDIKASQQIYEAPDTTKDPYQIHEAPDTTTKSPDKLHDVPKYELQG